MSELADLQRRLADALVQPEPAFPDVDEDGLRISALLVVRLRFERVLHGSPMGGEWFERDGADFAAAFKRYHAEVPPTAGSPTAEARLFEAWAEASWSP